MNPLVESAVKWDRHPEKRYTTGSKPMSNPKLGPIGRRSTRKRGQAMVEFAMVFPIFMLVLAGICDFGLALYQNMSVISAAREGARAAAMVSDPARVVVTAVGAATSAAANGGVTVTVDPSHDVKCLQTSVSVTSPTTIDCTTVHDGDSVSVTVDLVYHPFFPLLSSTDINLHSTVQMVFDNLPS
jgi:Flp pilus assembly protein TadG